jgi:hypothetical protein
MPRPAQRATTPAISSPPAPSTVSRVQFGGLVCPPTSQANQGFARTDAVCPLNRHPEHLANLGLALAADPQIANLPIALRVPVKLRKAVHGRASSAPRPILARLGVRGGARIGVSRRGSILTTATARYDATSARPARGRREVAITAAPDRKERTRHHGSQSGSSERDLCNARHRARRLCGPPLPRLLRRWLSIRNPRLPLRRVAGMAGGIVCRCRST